ncbi:MAG TPA: hypothetical protein VF950_03585 [Planctomycetota bacterium]
MDSARRPIRKLLALLAAALAGAALAVLLWARSRVHERWAEMERRVAELAEEARARPYRLPSPPGPLLPGNAWDDYAAAAREIWKVFGDGRGRQALLDVLVDLPRGTPVSYEEFRALLATCPHAFDLLIRGARREDGRYPRDWGRLEADDAGGRTLNWLANAALVEARRLARSGETSRALTLLWAMARMGLDLGHNGTTLAEMLGGSFVIRAYEVLWVLVDEGRLDRPGLADVDRGLEVLDRNFFAHGPALRNDVLSWGQMYLRGGFFPERESLKDARPTWRQLYSADFMKAASFLRMEELSRLMAAAESLPYAEARRVADDAAAELAASRNPLDRALKDGLPLAVARLEWIARIRLLRAIVRYRLDGQVPVLDDPFGTTLRSSVDARVVRVWSLGKNGVDDGGRHNWRDGDLVLEGPR